MYLKVTIRPSGIDRHKTMVTERSETYTVIQGIRVTGVEIKYSNR